MAWLQENWIVVALVAALLVALCLWLWLRRPPGKPIEKPLPRAALQPVKPEIVPAQPAHFAAPEPAAPAPIAASPAPIAPSAGTADNLALLKGVGPKLVTLLGTLGITRFDQIAGWNDADIAAIDAQLGPFQGRIVRDNWVDQAGFLARGDKAGFEAKYGALGSEL